jgi:hypothetical protein
VSAGATGEILRAYGFDHEADDGALVRLRGDRALEKFAPVDGGWHFFVMRDGVWMQRLHHADDVDGVIVPDMLWPDADVARVYQAALESRAANAAGS